MKLFCFLLSFSCFLSFGQDLKKIQKKYSIEICEGTDYLIVSKKGKSGIYDKKNQEFVLEPSSSHFLYVNKHKVLYEFNENNEVIVRAIKSKDFPESKLISEALNSFYLYKEIYEDYTPGVYYLQNGKLCLENSQTMKIGPCNDSLTLSDLEVFKQPNYIQSGFGVKKKGNLVIVSDFANDVFVSVDVAVQSIEYPGEDSIDNESNFVYNDIDIKGYQHSGVFDIIKNQWVIQPQYFRILSLNNLLFCNKQDSFSGNLYFPRYGHWDIFRIEDEKLELIKENVRWAAEIPLEEMFAGKGYQFAQRDSSYITFELDGKKGLMHLSMFYNTDYLNEGEPAYASLNLYHDTLISANYDMIANIGDELIYPEYLLLNNNKITYLNLDYDQVLRKVTASKKLSIREYGIHGYDSPEFTNWIIDDRTYKQIYHDSLTLISSIIEHPTYKRLLSRRSMEILNDSLIYIEYWVKQGTHWEPVYGLDYGDILLNEKGEELYYPPEPGEFRSGVFNLKSGDWLYDREYAWISRSYDNFHLCFPELDSAGYYETYLFQVDDFNQNKIDELNDAKLGFNSVLPTYKADTLYPINQQTTKNFGYFETDNKIGLYYKGYPEIIVDPKDYVYYNPIFNFYFSIEDESCRFKMGAFDTLFNISSFSKITVLPANNILPRSGDLFLQICSDSGQSIIHVEDQNSRKKVPFSKAEYEAYYHQEIGNLNWHFSVTALNDSLIYIEDWLEDEKFSDINPIMSIEYPFEDSINSLGELIYPPLKPGYCRSGVYDLNSKTWILDRVHYKIEMAEDQFLLRKPIRDENNLIEHYQFTIINLDNEIIWDGKDDNEIPDESPFFNFIDD